MNKTAIIAFGGNALSPKGGSGEIEQQFQRTRESLEAVMIFVNRNYNLCLTHGNGPQVGDELMRMELTYKSIAPLPMGVCVAATQGTIGYMIQQSLQNALKAANIDREVTTLITQVVVDPQDPSIANPSKYIGRTYPLLEAQRLAEKFKWTISEQNAGQWRRVVASPLPQFVMHGKSIKTLVENGTIVLGSGGGGIPVFYDKKGNLEGLDAVIDKDLSAALLGRVIRAEELWIITDVDHVMLNFGTSAEKPVHEMSQEEAHLFLKQGHFQAGSMEPKIRAALYFLKHYGKKVVITSIPQVKNALEGKSGTIIRGTA